MSGGQSTALVEQVPPFPHLHCLNNILKVYFVLMFCVVMICVQCLYEESEWSVVANVYK